MQDLFLVRDVVAARGGVLVWHRTGSLSRIYLRLADDLQDYPCNDAHEHRDQPCREPRLRPHGQYPRRPNTCRLFD